MTTPGQFPRRMFRAVPATAAPPTGAPADCAAEPPAAGSWPWRRAALLLCIAAQLITIAALEGADPIPATWAAVLLAIAPAPLAAGAALSRGQLARRRG